MPGRDDVFIYGMAFVYITAAIICLFGAMLTAWRLYGKKVKIKGVPVELYYKNTEEEHKPYEQCK